MRKIDLSSLDGIDASAETRVDERGHRRVIRPCWGCGQQFWACLTQIKRGKGKYCSLRCAASAGQAAMREACPQTRDKPSASALGRRAHKATEKTTLRPRACEACKQIRKLDGHHDDYSRPDDVRWLCRSCHMKHHYAAVH